MKSLLSSFILLLSVQIFAQTSLQSVHPFQPGEKLSYIASYNMKGLMTDLAGIDMEVSNVPGKVKPIYKLKFTANTLTSWDDYVKVRHAYQTFVDANTIKPIIMTQDSDVKGNITKGKYSFKPKSGTVQIETTKNGTASSKQLKFSKNTVDIVSLIYLARTLNYNNYAINNSMAYDAVVLERSLPVLIRYLGKETIKVEGMDAKECYKVGIVLKQKFVVEPDVTFVWITTDKNRVPVQISTVFKEGKALVKLHKFEGLKYN